MIKLPLLEKYYYQKIGCKNFVKQLLAPSLEIDIDSVTSHKGYSILVSGEHQYCLVIEEKYAPEGYEYILRVNKKVTTENISSGDIKFLRWIKHPLESTYSTEEVVSSWDR